METKSLITQSKVGTQSTTAIEVIHFEIGTSRSGILMKIYTVITNRNIYCNHHLVVS